MTCNNFYLNLNYFSDDEVVTREAEAIKIDELNTAQIKELRDKVRCPFFFYCYYSDLSFLFNSK